jgi:hypothetical protein
MGQENDEDVAKVTKKKKSASGEFMVALVAVHAFTVYFWLHRILRPQSGQTAER